MTGPPPLVHSILTRLKNEAHAAGRPFAEMLELFAVERLLHRLGRSEHRDAFVLKGALLLRHWLGTEARPTRDIDLLGPANMSADRLHAILTDVLQVEVEDDGIEFDRSSITVRPIRADSPVIGLRAHLLGHMARTRLRYQIDVGLGDAVFPPAEEVAPGHLLGFPTATVLAYTPYTVVAEKLEAMIQLGMANSRMKDYWDLVMLPRALSFDGSILVESVVRSFERRGTPFPAGAIEGLSDAFAESPLNRTRWRGFREKSQLASVSADLGEVVAEIRRFIEPLVRAVRGGKALGEWPAGGPWVPREGGRS